MHADLVSLILCLLEMTRILGSTILLTYLSSKEYYYWLLRNWQNLMFSALLSWWSPLSFYVTSPLTFDFVIKLAWVLSLLAAAAAFWRNNKSHRRESRQVWYDFIIWSERIINLTLWGHFLNWHTPKKGAYELFYFLAVPAAVNKIRGNYWWC